MRLALAWLLLTLLAPAEPLRRGALLLEVPANWTVDPPQDEDESLSAVLRSPRGSTVVIRHYAQGGESLDDAFRRLRYSVVLRQEGQVQARQALKLQGRRVERVAYRARSERGAMKDFLRYFWHQHGELWVVHAICSPQKSLDMPEFDQLVTSIQIEALESEETPSQDQQIQESPRLQQAP